MKKQDNKQPAPISDAFEWFGCTAEQIEKEEGTTPELDKATVKRVDRDSKNRIISDRIKHIKKMATPIKETPIVKAQDAIKFKAKVTNGIKDKISKSEFEIMKANFKKIKSLGEKNDR